MAVTASRPSIGRKPTLRPPTVMLDLLLGTVMVFAFHLGPVTRPAAVDTRDVSAPGISEAAKPLLLYPVRGPNGPAYREEGQSRLLSATEVVALAGERGGRLALVADPRVPLGAFLEAEAPLRSLGLDVALAVTAQKDERRKP